LILYDILGHEIVILVNENLLPGKYEIECDVSGYPGGEYFLSLQTGYFSDCKSMILLK